MASIETAIRTILTGDTDVTALVSTRIYPLAAPQSATKPFIVYEVDTVDPIDSLSGHSGLSFAEFSVSMWDDSYSTVKDVAAKVRIALLDFSGTSDTIVIDWVRHDNSSDQTAWSGDGGEFPLYGIEQSFRVAYQI